VSSSRVQLLELYIFPHISHTMSQSDTSEAASSPVPTPTCGSTLQSAVVSNGHGNGNVSAVVAQRDTTAVSASVPASVPAVAAYQCLYAGLAPAPIPTATPAAPSSSTSTRGSYHPQSPLNGPRLVPVVDPETDARQQLLRKLSVQVTAAQTRNAASAPLPSSLSQAAGLGTRPSLGRGPSPGLGLGPQRRPPLPAHLANLFPTTEQDEYLQRIFPTNP
jgi:hypothetical protein